MDLADPAVWSTRSWRWFTARLFGLSLESRTWKRLLGNGQQAAEEATLDEADAALGVERQ